MKRTHVHRALLALLTFGLTTSTMFAHQGAPPPIWQNTKAVADVPQRILPATDVAAELAADATMQWPGPTRYAVARPVNVSPATDGTWEAVAGGRLWRWRVSSTNATDLNFGFTSFWLPKGAMLYILAESEPYYQGPYTSLDNTESGQLWTPVVPGQSAVVELFVPDEALADPRLVLTQVSTGYRDLFHRKDGAGFPKAETCEIDVACPQSAPWTNEIRSVARISIGGTGFCTATMMMDAAGDFKNYLLTANHCGINAGNAATVVAYWNYQSPTCGQHGLGGSLAQNTSGATFRASKYDVDFCLIELTSTPDVSYGVYWAGWDRSGAAPATVVGIHHPNADGKCISFCSNALTTVNSCIGTGGSSTHWSVTWSLGVTEPGSSGSGIWDMATRKVVGTLSGGGSDCSTPTLADCYGKFSVAWAGGGATTNRLQNWLDAANTGATSVAGTYPVVTVPPNDQCSGAIPLTTGALYTENTANATSTGDPTPSCQTTIGKGVWFTYTPPSSGTVTIATCGSSFDTVLAIYTGGCGSLTQIACNDDNGPSCSGVQASVSFTGTTGVTYHILAAGYAGASGTLNVRALLPNDSCAGAIPLSPDVTVTEDTTTASSTNDAPTCRSNSGAGVWFSFTPAVSEPVLVATCGSSFDTVLAVYSGPCGSLTQIACDDDNGPGCSGVQASLTFNGAAGTTYYIQAAGYNTNTGTLQIVARVANDECSGAVTLSPGVPYYENTTDATSTNDPVMPCVYNPGKGVWFVFTPTNSGVLAISLCGSDYDTGLEVFTGACGALTPVSNGCNDDAGWGCYSFQSSVAFPASVGTTYYILAGGYNNHSGNLSVVANVVPSRTLTVNSSPNSGVTISVAEPDIYGTTGGVTPFAATYPDGASVHLQAPTSDGYNLFRKWQLDGVDYTNGPTAVVYLGAAHTATAIYAPPNDYCSGAIWLTNGVAFAMNNSTATSDGDPMVACGVLNKGVWFKYVAQTNELVTVSTCGSSLDTMVQVFNGDCGSLKRIPYGCDDDNGPACIGLNASVVFSGHAGVTNYILVGSYGSGGGNFTITATSGLVNDNCAGALPLAYGVPFSMTTIGATTGVGETPPCQPTFGKSVWFMFTSPITGPVPISTCGSSFDTVLQVFTGACGALTSVACADDNGPYCSGNNASLNLNALAGTNYYIMAGGWASQSGTLNITVGTRPVITAVHAGNLVQPQWPTYYWPNYVLQRYTNAAGLQLPGNWVDQLPNYLYPVYGMSNGPAFFRLITP